MPQLFVCGSQVRTGSQNIVFCALHRDKIGDKIIVTQPTSCSLISPWWVSIFQGFPPVHDLGNRVKFELLPTRPTHNVAQLTILSPVATGNSHQSTSETLHSPPTHNLMFILVCSCIFQNNVFRKFIGGVDCCQGTVLF